MKKYLKPLLLLIAVLIIVSCGQDNESGFNITLKNTDSYTYTYLDHIEWQEGDEVKWTIKTQAQNYEISEIVKTDSSNMKWEYHYKPKEGYVGKDHVILDIYTKSSDGTYGTFTQRLNFRIKKEN